MAATQTALSACPAARSGQLCYWPGCPQQLFADIDAGSRFVVHVAVSARSARS